MIGHYRQRRNLITLLTANSLHRVPNFRQRRGLTEPIALAQDEDKVQIVPIPAAMAFGRLGEVHFRVVYRKGGEHRAVARVSQRFVRDLLADIGFDTGAGGVAQRTHGQLAAEVNGSAMMPAMMLNPALNTSGQ